ncbi:hypothetical protein PV327_007435 [Microctonus hyperodae]|uniref:Protein-lysine N-methyltransferase SMYD4 n=1 Tax=Microctonus hyperodae TaxID=165561 RepID=A0AA39KYQ0_MICHY|nr:hypothetical protein PV327_007435 [Microctonus hyperodae]
MKQFDQYSKDGDRYSMIEMVMQVEQASKLEITSLFNCKDNCRAQELYNNAQFTEALFAVTANTSLFFEIITTRIQHWFAIGSYIKCYKDCDYAMTSLSIVTKSNVEMEDVQKYQAICMTMKKKCIKLLNKKKLKGLNIDNMKKIPKINGTLNKKLICCSDALTFAHKIVRGRHLVATRNIKAGSVLIVDKPFAFSTDNQALLTNCLHCHISLESDENIKIPCLNCQSVSFCSENCCKEAWNNYHKYECSIFGNFIETSNHVKTADARSFSLLAYRTTIAKAINKQFCTLNPEFLDYQSAKCENVEKSLEIDMSIDTYDPLDYRTVYSLETHCYEARPNINLARAIKSVYLAKCLVYSLRKIQPKANEIVNSHQIILLAVAMMRHMQAINYNAYEIVENYRNETSKVWEPRSIGGAIYTSVSLVNHGCYPNIVRHSYPGGIVVVRSIRFIEKGSEIFDCYGPHFISDPLSDRQRYLKECSSCSRKIDIIKLNDKLMRSVKNRVIATSKMYEGCYSEALLLLLDHSGLIDKILIAPCNEIIKTQQSIIQCYNSMGNVSQKKF